VDIEGRKDVLGLYTDESEGAKFWLTVLTDLKARGVEDILIALHRWSKRLSAGSGSYLSQNRSPIMYCSPAPLFHALYCGKR